MLNVLELLPNMFSRFSPTFYFLIIYIDTHTLMTQTFVHCSNFGKVSHLFRNSLFSDYNGAREHIEFTMTLNKHRALSYAKNH